MDATTWDTVTRLVEWLDTNSPLPPETDKLLRIMKLSEEVGEVSRTVIGATGQNVRKGVTHTWEDVTHELVDVIVTAMVALTTLIPDARRVFAERLAFVADRAGVTSS
jgi:hypothetical protein